MMTRAETHARSPSTRCACWSTPRTSTCTSSAPPIGQAAVRRGDRARSRARRRRPGARGPLLRGRPVEGAVAGDRDAVPQGRPAAPDPEELHELHFRAARCANELGAAKALGYYTVRRELDGTPADAARPRRSAVRACRTGTTPAKAYQMILVQHRSSAEGDVVARLHRLGHGSQGARPPQEGARDVREGARARSAPPRDAARRDRVCRRSSPTGTPSSAPSAASSRPRTSEKPSSRRSRRALPRPPAERAEGGRAYVEALEHAPESHQLLQKLLDLYIETQAVEAARSRRSSASSRSSSDAFKKGLYFHAAATLCRDELKSLDEAVDYYDCALDSFFAEPDSLDESDAGSRADVIPGDRRAAHHAARLEGPGAGISRHAQAAAVGARAVPQAPGTSPRRARRDLSLAPQAVRAGDRGVRARAAAWIPTTR